MSSHSYIQCDMCRKVMESVGGDALQIKINDIYGDKDVDLDFCSECSKKLLNWIEREKKNNERDCTPKWIKGENLKK